MRGAAVVPAPQRAPGGGPGGAPGARRRRLDLLLVERGLAPTRERARAAILAGEVLVDGQPVAKPGRLVPSGAIITVVPRRPRYVSRGGEKLEHALRTFGLDVRGAVALDVGASTGGFTDCLLQHGAARVYAVDVGRGQLDWRLRQDPRVVVRERTHAAHLDARTVPEPVQLATVDVSFISLVRVLPAVARRLAPGGLIVALVKPQFEAGRGMAPGGVVRDPAVHRRVLTDLVAWARRQGWGVAGVTASPLRGPKGNREFFLLLVPDPRQGGRALLDDAALAGAIEAAVAAPAEAEACGA